MEFKLKICLILKVKSRTLDFDWLGLLTSLQEEMQAFALEKVSIQQNKTKQNTQTNKCLGLSRLRVG